MYVIIFIVASEYMYNTTNNNLIAFLRYMKIYYLPILTNI